MTSRDQFESAFAGGQVSREVLDATFELFTQWAPPGHSVQASDNISVVYGMVDEDFDDAVRSILRACGCRVPGWSEAIRTPRMQTIADLVDQLMKICNSSPARES